MESELHRSSADKKIVFGKRKDNSRPCYTFEPGILKCEGGIITKMFAEPLGRTQEITKWQ